MRRLFRLGTLEQYVARQNLYYMIICLGVGTCIYLLSDLFDRLDDFVEKGLGVGTMLYYFGVKVPVIFSQILPAVYLLALVVQLGVMARNKEIVAMRAGGISMAWFIRFFLMYAVFWSFGQFFFSQYIGIYGEQEAHRIWKEDVRKHDLEEMVIEDLWFRDGAFIVHAEQARPSRSRATGVTVYEFDPDSQRMIRIITAEKALVDEHGWGLLNVDELDARTFKSIERPSSFLSVRQNLQAFRKAELSRKEGVMPIWELSSLIERLEVSGANVENLRTVWHSKWSYAFTIFAMTLIALALVTFSENMYANIGISLALIFLHYGLHIVGLSAGQKGVLPPIVAAWLANIFFSTLATLRLVWVTNPAVQKYILDWWGLLHARSVRN